MELSKYCCARIGARPGVRRLPISLDLQNLNKVLRPIMASGKAVAMDSARRSRHVNSDFTVLESLLQLESLSRLILVQTSVMSSSRDNPYLSHLPPNQRGAAPSDGAEKEPLYGWVPRMVKASQVQKALVCMFCVIWGLANAK
jgi:hypothetical protein